MNNDRFKFRVPIRCNACKFQGFQYWEWNGQQFIENGHGKCKCEAPAFEIVGQPQQCTGWRDINNELIFAGHGIRHMHSAVEGVVIWDDKHGSFVFIWEDGEKSYYNPYSTVNDIEIIGTIHGEEK